MSTVNTTEPAPAHRGVTALVRTGALSMLALVAVGLTRLVHGSLTSHATDRQTYGLVGIMLAASTVASLLLPGGLASGVAKFVAYHRGAGDVAGAWAVHRFLSRLGLVSSLLLGVAAALAVDRLYQLSWVDAVSLGVLTASYSLYTVDKAAMYGHGLVPQYARVELGTSLLAVVGTIVLITAGQTAYLAPLCLGYGLFVVLCRLRLRRYRRAEQVGRAGVFDRRQVIAFALLGSVGTLASAGFLQATQLLAGHFATPAEAAFLAASVALVAPLYFLPRAMALALFPAMSSAQGAGNTSAVREQVDASTRALAVTMAPVFLVGLLSAPVLLRLFGGDGYADGAGVLRLMLCASFLAILQVPSVNALASGPPAQTRIPVASAVTGCLVGLGVVAVAAGPWGALGVAAGYLVGTAVTAAIPLLAAARIHRLGWGAALGRGVGLVVTATVVTQLDLPRWADLTAAAVLVLGAAALLGGDLRRLAPLLRRRAGTDPAPVSR